MTAKRRAERKQFKLDRAAAIAAAARAAEMAFVEGREVDTNIVIPSAATWKPSNSLHEIDIDAPEELDGEDEEDDPEYKSLEHLQLTLQEAFFLSCALGCFKIKSKHNVRLPKLLCQFLPDLYRETC